MANEYYGEIPTATYNQRFQTDMEAQNRTFYHDDTSQSSMPMSSNLQNFNPTSNCGISYEEPATYCNLESVVRQNTENIENMPQYYGPLPNYPAPLKTPYSPQPYAPYMENNYCSPRPFMPRWQYTRRPYSGVRFLRRGCFPRMGFPHPQPSRGLFAHKASGPFRPVPKVRRPRGRRPNTRYLRSTSCPVPRTTLSHGPSDGILEPLDNFHNYSAPSTSKPSTLLNKQDEGMVRNKRKTFFQRRQELESDSSDDSDLENYINGFQYVKRVKRLKNPLSPYNYRKLIEEALVHEGSLTVNEIYNWIFERNKDINPENDKLKKLSILNTIRYNLSIGKDFVRLSNRSSNGYLWSLTRQSKDNDEKLTDDSSDESEESDKKEDGLDDREQEEAVKSILTYEDFSNESHERELAKSARNILWGNPSPKVIVELVEPNFPMSQEWASKSSDGSSLSPLSNDMEILDLSDKKSYVDTNFKNTSDAIDFMINLI